MVAIFGLAVWLFLNGVDFQRGILLTSKPGNKRGQFFQIEPRYFCYIIRLLRVFIFGEIDGSAARRIKFHASLWKDYMKEKENSNPAMQLLIEPAIGEKLKEYGGSK